MGLLPRRLRRAFARRGGGVGSQLGLVARLAARDYRHEWVMSGCSVLALAAVLIPLLVLFGLRYGIITNLLSPLIENPRYREIAPSTSGNYAPAWFDAMRERDGVAFVVPRTRALAATIKLRVPEAAVGQIIDVELIPSAPGDPVLEPQQRAPAGFDRVLLSTSAAEALGVEAGAQLEGLISRTFRGAQETVRLPLTLTGVTQRTAFERDDLFVSTELLVAVEDFLDGRGVPALDWEGGPLRASHRSFPRFRMYAASLDDVVALRSTFIEQGIDVRTNAADIELVRTLDRNLGIVYWVIAAVAITGYGLSFGTSVWANVDRKRREYSMLRLTGFRTRGIVWFPVLQAALTGVLAWALASGIYFIIEGALNGLFAQGVGDGQPVCRLRLWHLFAALGLTLTVAALAATAGGRRVARLEPSIGLRDG